MPSADRDEASHGGTSGSDRAGAGRRGGRAPLLLRLLRAQPGQQGRTELNLLSELWGPPQYPKERRTVRPFSFTLQLLTNF